MERPGFGLPQERGIVWLSVIQHDSALMFFADSRRTSANLSCISLVSDSIERQSYHCLDV